MEAAKLELRIRAAQMGVGRAEAELKAEQERLTGPEAKKALKNLETINKQGLALTKEITEELEALDEKMGHWEQLQKQSKAIAREYNADPFDLGIAGSRLIRVRQAIKFWVQEVRSWKRHNEIMAMPNHGFKRVMPTKEVRKSKRR